MEQDYSSVKCIINGPKKSTVLKSKAPNTSFLFEVQMFKGLGQLWCQQILKVGIPQQKFTKDI